MVPLIEGCCCLIFSLRLFLLNRLVFLVVDEGYCVLVALVTGGDVAVEAQSGSL